MSFVHILLYPLIWFFFHKYLMDAVNKGNQVDAIFTDISKAFDTVNHAILIRKLELMGVNNMLKWFSPYISFRSQKIRINRYILNNILVSSGVSQGIIFPHYCLFCT